MGRFERAIRQSDRPVDAAVAGLAHRQHGIAAHDQLLRLGLSHWSIQRRIAAGRLHPIYRGVYSVGHQVLTLRGRWMAAVLACGDGALLSHFDAAALWDLRRAGRGKIHVTSARSRAGHHGLQLHRPRRVDPDDRAVVDGIPVTSVARTLLDLAGVLRQDQLERLVEQAELRKLFDLRAVDQLLQRSRGRRGTGKLMSVIADLRPFVPMTRSDLERAFVQLCRDEGLPEPAMNLWLHGYEVDALFREDAIVVELDGGEYHATTAARKRDPIRDARLQAAGYRILRVHERWLHEAPAAVRALMRTSRRSA